MIPVWVKHGERHTDKSIFVAFVDVATGKVHRQYEIEPTHEKEFHLHENEGLAVALSPFPSDAITDPPPFVAPAVEADKPADPLADPQEREAE